MRKKKLMSPEQLESARREPTIHQAMNHPRIVTLYEYTETDDDIRMFMEHMNMSDYLADKIEEVLFHEHGLGRDCDQSKTKKNSVASSLRSLKALPTSTPRVLSIAI